MPSDSIRRRDLLKSGLGGLAVTAGVNDKRPATMSAACPAVETPGYDGHAHSIKLFDDILRRHAFKARTAEELSKWQKSFRHRLRDLLGLVAMDEEVRFKLRAQRAERRDMDGYVREKWYLWTEPDVPLPLWVLVPERPVSDPPPLLLTPHGHNAPEVYLGLADNEKERRSMAEGERDIAVQAVRQGYLCVLPTSRGFGETRREEDKRQNKLSSCRTELLHQILFGRTVIGCRVWDISRILDWLGHEYSYDRRRIAITGNSGGGTTSLFAAACDERISVSVPSCYFCTFRDSIGSIQHCECNYVPGLLREAEMYDVAALIAPRPVRMIAGQSDQIFPIIAVRKAYERLSVVYRAAGVPDHCDLYVGEGAHRYYSAGSWPFIRRYLLPNR